MENASVKKFTRGVGGIVNFNLRDSFLASFMPGRVIFASFDHSKEEKNIMLHLHKAIQTKSPTPSAPGRLIRRRNKSISVSIDATYLATIFPNHPEQSEG